MCPGCQGLRMSMNNSIKRYAYANSAANRAKVVEEYRNKTGSGVSVGIGSIGEQTMNMNGYK